jgi:glycosyltransferase involved in cell wall biosynthesis
MNKLSVVIIAFNEEDKILKCLTSVQGIADEILVIDSGSTDNTVQICEDQGCRVLYRAFDFHAKQKQYAVSQAKNDWVFSIDADEIISDKMRTHILSLLGKDSLTETPVQPANSGYTAPIRLYYLGRRMKMSGRAHTIRLFNRKKGGFVQVPVHEYVSVEGTAGRLKGEILHFSYRDLRHHLEKMNAYTSYAAAGYRKANKSYPKIWVILKFPVTFFIHYIIRGGIVDGYRGFMWAFFAGLNNLVKIAKTIEMTDQP